MKIEYKEVYGDLDEGDPSWDLFIGSETDANYAGNIPRDSNGEKIKSILSQHAALVKIAKAAERYVAAEPGDDGYDSKVAKYYFKMAKALSAWRSTIDGGKEGNQ